MSFAFTPDAHTLSAGLLILRLILGLLIAAHGAQKLFGWFGGYGLAGTAGYFETLGFHPGRFYVAAAAVGELVSSVLIVLGFLGPVGPALLLAIMIVAAVSAHLRNGIFAAQNGIEVSLLYSAGAVALAFTGPGLYSLDAALGLGDLHDPRLEVATVVAGIVGATVNLMARRHPVAAT